jgi:hypothetical protein
LTCIGASKATEGLGANLDARITSLAELERLELPEHTRWLVRACWALGGRRELAPLGLRRWAHMLGFGGHWTTKSRRYSVTFAALRAARRAWSARRRHGTAVRLDQDGRLLPRPASPSTPSGSTPAAATPPPPTPGWPPAWPPTTSRHAASPTRS